VLPSTSSQGLNRYSYCANNPLIYTDPNGHYFGLIALIVATIIGAVVGNLTSAIFGGNVWMGTLAGAISGACVEFGYGGWCNWGAVVGAIEHGGKLAEFSDHVNMCVFR